MATFIPPQHNSQPHTDFPANTPPDRDGYAQPPSGHFKSMSKPSRKSQQRFSGEFRGANGLEGGRAIPTGPQAQAANGPPWGPALGAAGFEGSRSPPNAKNTSHVPCKFFKVGQCQAGQACPFSHATDASAFEQPCKYFSRGNCKFGHKCALLHVLPNGRVVNRPNSSLSHLNIGNRVEPAPYHQESVLGNSLAQQPNMAQPFGHQIPQMQDMDLGYHASPSLQPYDIPQPTSHPQQATPREDHRTPMSPQMHLTALDAPLPASFDSQGISYLARHGPVAASVPSKFGFDSPPQSLPQKSGVPLDTLRNLHESAYGSSNGPGMGSSPSGPLVEPTGPRMMHSQRVARPKMVSASLPRPNTADEWETEDLLFGGEEDYIPGNLSHLLNPEERSRRNSGRVEDPQSIHDNLGVGEFSRKIGSPSTASPSRFADFFNKKKQEENGASSSFGHVGSPRGRSSQLGSSPGPRSVPRSSGPDLAFYMSSPPRQSATSMLSQQLQRTRLSRGESNEGSPGMTLGNRHASNPRSVVDRAVSTSSVNTGRIEEEQSDFLFAFDDIGSNSKSGNSPWNQGKSSNLGSIGDGRRSLDREASEAKGHTKRGF